MASSISNNDSAGQTTGTSGGLLAGNPGVLLKLAGLAGLLAVAVACHFALDQRWSGLEVAPANDSAWTVLSIDAASAPSGESPIASLTALRIAGATSRPDQRWLSAK